MIYLDNAATTLHKPPAVIEAVVEAMRSHANPGRGTNEGAMSAARTTHRAREKTAKLFGCPEVERVVFTSNSTEALNIAIQGLLKAGDHVISTDLEHNSVLRPLYLMERERGVALSFVRADGAGRIACKDFESLIRPETRAIVCTHASNLTGDAIDIRTVGNLARRHGLLFILDASQSAGCLPIDMEEDSIDVVCFTGHKGLMAPQGTGGLCIGEHVDIRPLKVGGSGIRSFSREQPKEYPVRLEAGTLNSHGIAGLLAAIDFVQDIGIDRIHEKENRLMRQFYEGVSVIDGVTVYGDFKAPARTAIVSLNIRDFDSGAVSDELSVSHGIATRPGAHCAPRLHEALGTASQGAVRFSFGWFNTEEEVERAVEAVREIAT